MKHILSIIPLLFLAGSGYADTFYVGGTQLDIPSPQGYSRVTQQMDAVYRIGQQMEDPRNDLLAYYIPDSDVPAAMSGVFPPFKRYYLLKVNKRIKEMVVGSKDFAELKTLTTRQNKEIFKALESQIPGLTENMSKGLSTEFDVNVTLQVSQILPLDPHYETDNSFAYSMYMHLEVSVEGAKEDVPLAVTATFVNLAGKILFLYCYAPQNDLEWTRDASKAWAGSVMASNVRPPSRTSGSRGMDWSKVFAKGIVGATIGVIMAVIVVIVGVFSKFNKKKEV